MHAGRATTQEIEFLVEVFDAEVEGLGHMTIAAKARFVDTDHGHFWRIWHKQKKPGEVFVGRVLNAPWPKPVKFEKFFRYREVPK